MAKDDVSGLAENMGGLSVEDEPSRVLDSLTLEGIVKVLKGLQSSKDSKSSQDP